MIDWNVLKKREIIDLFIGDKKFSETEMPYMTGIEICEFSKKIGFIQIYNIEKLSRWQYMEKLLDYVIGKDKINVFFKELLNIQRFRTLTDDPNINSDAWSIQEWHSNIISELVNSINKYLIIEQCYIEYDLETYQFFLVDLKNNIEICTSKIDEMGSKYIKRISNEAYNAIKKADYESAITKSRTLIEEVLIKGIEKKKMEPCRKGNIHTLYKQFKELYDFHSDKGMDRRINQILSGLNSILSSISEMRNKNSDSHGVGEKRLELNKPIAELFVNSSMTLSNFLLYVIEDLHTLIL